MIIEVIIQIWQIQADVLADDVNASAASKGWVEVHHASIEAVTGISRHAVVFRQSIVPLVPVAEGHQVAVLQLTALRRSCRTRGVKHDEEA